MKAKGIIALLVVATAMMLSACGASRVAGWDREIEAQSGDEQAVLAEAEAAWAERGDKAQLERAIELYQKAAAINPQNLATLSRIARAYYFLADAHYMDDAERQADIYDLGTAAGERALALSEDFRNAEDKFASETLAKLGPEYVPAIYWMASSLGKWGRLKGFVTLLKVKGKVKAAVEAATEKNIEFFHHAPDRYWGVYYSVAPSFAGGDVNVSKEKFESSLAGSPDYLGTKVLMADTYATKTLDKDLYVKLLNEVLEGNPDAIEGIEPEQKVEQIKAKRLLAPEEIEDRFGE